MCAQQYSAKSNSVSFPLWQKTKWSPLLICLLDSGQFKVTCVTLPCSIYSWGTQVAYILPLLLEMGLAHFKHRLNCSIDLCYDSIYLQGIYCPREVCTFCVVQCLSPCLCQSVHSPLRLWFTGFPTSLPVEGPYLTLVAHQLHRLF